jgi:cobalamin biosynthesis protein CobW
LPAAREVIAAEMTRPVPMLAMTEGVIDPRVILGLNAAAEDDLAARPSHHDGHDDHEHDDFRHHRRRPARSDRPRGAFGAIVRLADEQNILRVKGHVAVAGKPMRMLVQAVGARVRMQYDRPWGTAPRLSQLVVIAEHDDIDEAAIRKVLGV